MEDEHIVDLYWERSEKAITETASKYGKYCYSIAYNILADHDDAEECVSDTYLGAWNSMPPHRPMILSTFLGKITRRTAIKRWQSQHAAKRGGGKISIALEELEECIPSNQSVEQEMEAAELRKVVNEFVLSLPRTERNVFICRYWYLDGISDICQQFGFSQSKVKSMLQRTRKKLQIYLKKEGVYDEN
ncbi:MAG: sigma-70 family RNA polymerase sigma factor [Lachnospiraceae bacterium]|nr:sigma-70 family RNA polymerase sigma factor [Lachnospiraceae bacterium]